MAENFFFWRALAPIKRAIFAPVTLLLLASTVVVLTPSNMESRSASAAANLSRTFGAAGTGAAAGTTNNSTGTLGSAPSLSAGRYTWTVPSTGRYQITVEGAQGGNNDTNTYIGGAGTSVTTEWNLASGQTLVISVGHRALGTFFGGGGGGASGVVASGGVNNGLLVVAGGGGGAAYNSNGNGGVTTTSGQNSGGMSGGTNGSGGQAGWYSGDCGIGGGGGGYTGNGSSSNGSGSTPSANNTTGGVSYSNGGAGSTSYVCGAGGNGGWGFAGGGMAGHGGGGGGGYSGGAGGQYRYADFRRGGGGGGSFVGANALASSMVAASRTGAGNVVVTLLAPAPTTFASQTVSPTNVSSLNYDVVFSETVTGLDTSDFTVSGTSSGWSVTSLTGSGSTYVVTLASSSPTTGTVILTMLQNAVLGDSTSQQGPGGDTAAPTMNIDVDPPGASVSSTPSSPAAAMSLTFGMTFTESVSGIAASDFSNAGTAAGCVFTPSASSGTSINVVVTQCQEGTLQLQLASGGVVDAAGNTGPTTAVTSSVVTLAASALSITAASQTVNFGGTWTDSYSQSGLLGSDSITVTYSYSGTTNSGVSYGPSSTKPTQAGSYSIIPTITYGGSNTNRYALTVTNGSLAINRVSQSTLTVSTTSMTYGQTLSLATSGGSGTGAVSWQIVTGTCTLSGSTLTPGNAGSSCVAKATKAQDNNYLSVATVDTAITIGRASQAALLVSTTSTSYGNDLVLGTSGGSGTGNVSWQVVSGTCTIVGALLTPGNAGSSCVVRATKAQDTNYNSASSTDTTITINRASQSSLVVSSSSATYGQTLSLTTTGGSGTGAVSWQVVSGTCSVSSSSLTLGDAGSSCVVRATKAQDTNYNSASSTDTTITINRASQSSLVVSSSSATYGQTLSLTTTGGSGTGAVSWQVVSGTCTLSGTTLTPGNAGSSCVIKATKAQDTNYNAASSADTTITIGRASQATLSVSTTSTSYGNDLVLGTSGGSGTGNVSWQVVSGTCTIVGALLTPGNAGSACVVKATKAQDTNYNAASSADTTITINKATQNGFSITSASTFTTGSTHTLTASGGQSGGSISWQVTAGICSVTGSSLTASRGGVSCTVEATRAGSSNYFATTDTMVITVDKIVQVLTFQSTPPSSALVGGTYTVSVTSDASLAPTISIANASSQVCSISAGVITFLSAGSCTVNAAQAGNDQYAPAAASQLISVSTVPTTTTTVAPTQGGQTPVVSTTSTTVAPGGVTGNSLPSTTSTTSTTTTTTTSTTVPELGTGGVTEVKAGEATAMVQGKLVKVNVETVEGDIVVRLPNEVVVKVGAPKGVVTGAVVNSDGVLVAYSDDQFQVTADGFSAQSTYVVTMYSDPVELGRGEVGKSGSVASIVKVPKDADAGEHTLVFEGVGPDAEVVAVSIGFKVVERSDNTMAAVLAVSIAILLALLGGRPIWRRRKSRIS